MGLRTFCGCVLLKTGKGDRSRDAKTLTRESAEGGDLGSRIFELQAKEQLRAWWQSMGGVAGSSAGYGASQEGVMSGKKRKSHRVAGAAII